MYYEQFVIKMCFSGTQWGIGYWLILIPPWGIIIIIIVNYYWNLGINYFHCLKVLELLKVAEGDQKSLFGQYTSQKVKVCHL